MRSVVVALSSLPIVVLGFFEVALAFPVPGWVYIPVALLFTGTVLRPVSVRHQTGRLAVAIGVWGLVAILYFVNWSTRKPFLRDLYSIRPGMTEAQVRQVMGRYLEGTGWPTPPWSSTNEPGNLVDVASGTTRATGQSVSGQLTLRDSLVFRHSNDGAFNSDWGIVTLSNGHVVKVEFSPD